MASNMETGPCASDAWGSRYIEYRKAVTGVSLELL